MRADMSRVIVERPRLGSRANNDDKGEMKLRQKALENEDLLPGRQSTARGRRAYSKHLNEHLAPLRRFLNSRIGKHWSKVYAEIRENINPDSAVQMHIMQHLVGSFGYVKTNVKHGRMGRLRIAKGKKSIPGGLLIRRQGACRRIRRAGFTDKKTVARWRSRNI